jgi:Beta-galactosidase
MLTPQIERRLVGIGLLAGLVMARLDTAAVAADPTPPTDQAVTLESVAKPKAQEVHGDLLRQGSGWRLSARAVPAEQSAAGGQKSTQPAVHQALVRLVRDDGLNWNFSGVERLSINVRNSGSNPITVRVSISNSDASNLTGVCQTAATLMPGQGQTLALRVVATPMEPDYAIFKPFFKYYSHIAVRENTVDPTQVQSLAVWLDSPASDDAVEISDIRLVGRRSEDQRVAGQPAFFPFIDRYGQYVHADWPGKIHADSDFAANRIQEAKDLADWPGPKDWNAYGGWATGPQLEATGFFRVAKHQGKWWMVDPEGKLFWSYGATGAGFGPDLTPVTDREHWFAQLPAKDGPEGKFYKQGPKILYQYYADRDYTGYQFSLANAQIKYGPDAAEELHRVTTQRLRSWGFNSMGAWSAPAQMLFGKTAYATVIHYGAPGVNSHMPDVFNPEWEKNLRTRMEQERATTAKDPWNIGYFVDNERKWGKFPRFIGVAIQTLEAKPNVVSKTVLIDDLKAKYQTIDKLNQSWGVAHTSWDAMLQSTDKISYEFGKNANLDQDLGDFGMKFGHKYFSTCRRIVKEVAPNHMYMGARLHSHIDKSLIQVQTEHCDVISYNMYDATPVGRMRQYADIDFPFLITEWGIDNDPRQSPFRATTAQVAIGTKIPRQEAITRFAEQALAHPQIVGIHFFQYRDQPLSGRPDGEALLRGFLNGADTPNFELIQVNRKVAYDLYNKRAAAAAK